MGEVAAGDDSDDGSGSGSGSPSVCAVSSDESGMGMVDNGEGSVADQKLVRG